jgi:hypothetical protein
MSASLLISQTMNQLKKQLSQEAGIAIEMDTRWVRDMAEFLNEYDMEDDRRECILGCYILLRLSLQCHDGVGKDEQQLTKRILDGDYLQSLYFEYALRYKAMDLLRSLATVHKSLQIRRIEGKPADYLLGTAIQQFVTRRYAQVTYEVI